MDTTTHVTTGISLAGLSLLDPTVTNHPELLVGIFVCTIIGSNAPDIDFLFKYQGKEKYVQEHRGITHSIYAVIVLSFCIAALVSLFYGGLFFKTFLLWTFVSVVLHVIVDVFNIYGTQALRPFTNKWLALNVLPIFDPVIMGLQVIGIIVWLNGFHSGYTFSVIFSIIIGYIFLRFYIAYIILNDLKKHGKEESFTLIPTFSINRWTVISSCKEQYRLGKYRNGNVTWSKTLTKTSDKNQIIKAAKKNSFILHMLQLSPYLHAKIVSKNDGYEVHWFDLRYQSRIDEPFVAIIQLDQKLNLVKSYVKRGLISIPERI